MSVTNASKDYDKHEERNNTKPQEYPPLCSSPPQNIDGLQETQGTLEVQTSTSKCPQTTQDVQQAPRKSHRSRTLTEKGREMLKPRIKELEQSFKIKYEKWKVLAKDAHHSLSGSCSDEELQTIINNISCASRELNTAYENWRKVDNPDNNARRRIDSSEEITKNVIETAKCYLRGKKPVDTQFIGHESFLMSEKSYHTSKHSQSSSVCKDSQRSSRVTSKCSSATSMSRQEAAAKIAAAEATLEIIHEQQCQQAELLRLEAEDKRQIAEQTAEACRRRLRMEEEEALLKAKLEVENAARRKILEDKRRELERLEAIKQLSAAKASMQVYEQDENSEEEIRQLLHDCRLEREKESDRIDYKGRNVNAPELPSPQHTVTQPLHDGSIAALARVLADSISASRLPIPEPTVFSGDPLKYKNWKAAFQTLIDRKNILASEKIYYLGKYVGGPAKKAIENYFLLGTEAAYITAWEVLEERFGNSFLIAKAFRDKLNAWPKIGSKDSLELQEFVDFLRSCETAVTQINGLEILNDCNENQKILSKLPDWLTSRWNRKVLIIEEETGRFPSFSQFVQFLIKEAKIACNPVTSLHALKQCDGERAKPQGKRGHAAKVLSTNSDEKSDTLTCVFCERSGHSLYKCRRFLEKPTVERHKFVQESKLCFGCLKPGHHSRDCKNRNTCSTCQKRHPTCLHEDRKEEQKSGKFERTKEGDSCRKRNEQVEETRARQISEVTSNRVQHDNTSTQTSTIIPVWVSAVKEPNKETLVYALLDTQSDTTFILEETARSLKAKGEQVKLKLSTMASKTTVVSCQRLSGLQVRGFNSEKKITLPTAYTRKFIPANRDHIPTPETARAWAHLEHIADKLALPQSCEVGLLIGYNCSQALLPREVVSGEENQPFAQRTDLGWSIIGYASPYMDGGDAIGVSHQVITRQVTPSLQLPSSRNHEVHYVCRTQIKEVISSDQWNYVASEDNPADHSSRGLTAVQLKTSNWFRGPDFLWQLQLPSRLIMVGEISENDPELRKAHAHNLQSREERSLLDRLERFSDWTRAVRAVATLKRRVKGQKLRSNEPTTLEERKEAEVFLIRLVQAMHFPKNTMSRKQNGQIKATDKTNKLHKLNPFLDEQGVLRVGGRLTHSSLHPHVKHPAILPKENHLSTLLIKHYHERVQHQGRGMTVNELRANGVWILGCSKAVSSHIYNCTRCRKYRRSTEEQRMADLPQERAELTPPFTYCGMDCFGPIYIKEGRKELKRYGLLLTCMCSRAIHIEMLNDLTTDALINALRSFIALRGSVRQLRCDQGSNFMGARREFAEAMKEMDGEKLKKFGCEFIMNTPSASHQGGLWERQIRTVRNVLSSILDQSDKRLDSSSLRTFLYEVMAIVNSRPLTTEHLHNPSGPEPLTPNHILTMKSSVIAPPPGRFIKEDLYLQKRWRRVQFLANSFWARWKKEYLLNLQNRQKWSKVRRNAKVNDIVLLKDDSAPRNQWKMARITDVYPGKDGQVRSIRLLISDSTLDNKGRRTTKPTYLERPIQKIVTLLEADG
ncbi:uncharacterized protein LOC115798709 isoform X1 [Archocentrus centrarchus]|uniref:uncharacterized protein LOC115798709 isoform X1 n=2 Tax=Archocentrus centrarchus TaxID=63155 RepID=UPI0011E9CD9E|nr:uncharacterized protein LOC115798709 isoform X1 [Archocentrus centrarchus]